MGSLFKSFGKGILYLLVLPFLLVILAVYAAVGLLVFLFLGIKALILFFTGRSLYDDLPEDKQAKEIIASMSTPKAEATLAASTNNGSVATEANKSLSSNPSIYTNPNEVEEDPFYVPEYLKSPSQEKETINEEEPPVEEDLVDERDILYAPIHEEKEEKESLDDDSDNFNL